MAKISIRDLTDSVELDVEAMRAVSGGARTPGQRLQLLRKKEASARSSLKLMNQAREKKIARW